MFFVVQDCLLALSIHKQFYRSEIIRCYSVLTTHDRVYNFYRFDGAFGALVGDGRAPDGPDCVRVEWKLVT